MNLTTSDGLGLFYETFGDKANAPIVLVHGLAAEHGMWGPQIDTLPSHDLYTIVPDLRCHGQSSCGESFLIAECARDLAELLDHLNLTTAHFVGVSMGGMVVQQLACDFPDRVDRLIIVDSLSEVHTLADRSIGWIQWLTIKIAPRLLAKSLRAVYRGEDRAAARVYLEQMIATANKRRLLMCLAEIRRFDIVERLGEISAPTLVLVGDQFGKSSIKRAEKTAHGISGAQFQILEGGCDPSNLVVPEQFDHAILDFIP